MHHPLGPRLFTCAVITDTHLNQGEAECSSPFEVNKLANARMRHVVQDLNQRSLDFVVHLGDLLHPVPAVPHLYERAAANFKEQVAELKHRLYVIPGNHDVGDKPVDWSPASMVRQDFLDLWEEAFGPNHQAFDHHNCRFVLIDAQIINAGIEAEARQKTWLEEEFQAAKAAGKRVFLMTHYPPYLTYPDEDEHYDNIGEPGRSWLLGLMEKFEVEGLFAGHVHNFWFHRHGETLCWLLPSTAFVRQDYSEMYRTTPPPEMEAGRNDAAKLGYFLLHVHQAGHLCEVVRTYGQTLGPEEAPETTPQPLPPTHPSENAVTGFGFDMRQNWLEVIEIPPSGGLDEFDRKRTRNDYALMALMEMGVRRLRVPARDLLDPAHCARLRELKSLGFLFTLFSFNKPSDALTATLSENTDFFDAWEIAQAFQDLPEIAEAARPLARVGGIDLYLSKLRSKDEMLRGGEKYYHMINHGFTPDEGEQIAGMAKIEGLAGLVFRVAGETPPWQATQEALALCRPLGLKASLHIRMSLGSPGAVQADENWVAERVAEALASAAAHPDAMLYSDTFADVDRGYFVRQGVVDRLYNPRPAFHVLRALTAALNQAEGNDWLLKIGERKLRIENAGNEGPGGKGHWVRLRDGQVLMEEDPTPSIWIKRGRA